MAPDAQRWHPADSCASLTACRHRHPIDGAGHRRRTMDHPARRFANCLRARLPEPGPRARTLPDRSAPAVAPARRQPHITQAEECS